MKRYIWNVLIAIDQFFNAVLGGDPDETMSSRMGKRVLRKDCRFCKFVCGILNVFEKDHCFKSIERDEGEPMP
jgi:hypothetical protein